MQKQSSHAQQNYGVCVSLSSKYFKKMLWLYLIQSF